MLNDKQLEAAARKLCEIRGIAPDTRCPHGAAPDPVTGIAPAVLLYSPAWLLVADEIRHHEQIASAIAYGSQSS
jgi:hypothetical protein